MWFARRHELGDATEVKRDVRSEARWKSTGILDFPGSACVLFGGFAALTLNPVRSPTPFAAIQTPPGRIADSAP